MIALDNVTKQLMNGGHVIQRGYIGATIQNLSPTIAEGLGMQGQQGGRRRRAGAGRAGSARAGVHARRRGYVAVNGVAAEGVVLRDHPRSGQGPAPATS